jgi:hypothetical protein
MVRLIPLGFVVFNFISLSELTAGTVVVLNTVNAGLTGTAVREVRDGKLAGHAYKEDLWGVAEYEKGIIYNISTRTLQTNNYVNINDPSAVSTQINSISATDNNRYGGMVYFGNSLVPYRVYGFIRTSGGSYFTIEPSGATRSEVHGLSGDKTVGWFDIGGVRKGFLHQGNSYSTGFTTLEFPGASLTEARGVESNYVVGNTIIGGENYGFRYDIATGGYVAYRATGNLDTYFNDINDGLIVGTAISSGRNIPFLMQNGNYEFFDFQGNSSLSATGSSYDNGILAGSYVTSTGETLGYYANVPEPNTSTLFALSLFLQALLSRSRRLRTKQ